MSVNANVVLATARTLLNDDANTTFTDTVLLPKLAQAHRELQAKLRAAAAPVMRKSTASTAIGIGITVFPVIADLVEPIKLWERANADPDTSLVQMTEADPLPFIAQTGSLIYWQWLDEVITFVGSTAARSVKVMYWRALPEPASAGDSIGFINGELYLAPRTAALAAGSTGNEAVFNSATAMAEASLMDVILANKGRAKPNQTPSVRP